MKNMKEDDSSISSALSLLFHEWVLRAALGLGPFLVQMHLHTEKGMIDHWGFSETNLIMHWDVDVLNVNSDLQLVNKTKLKHRCVASVLLPSIQGEESGFGEYFSIQMAPINSHWLHHLSCKYAKLLYKSGLSQRKDACCVKFYDLRRI